MSSPAADPERVEVGRAESKREVTEYYRTVGRFLDLELAGRDDAGYWARRARELGRPRVLELGAGTGRVTRVLAPLSEFVVAIDLSREMLLRAKRSLGNAAGVHLVAADMRELDLGTSFDLVLAANDPFVHIRSDEGRDRAVRAAARHLRPGGLFIVDALWLRPARRRKAMEPGGWQRERTLPSSGGRLRVAEAWTLASGSHSGRIRYEYRDGDEVVGRAAFHPRLWTPEELRERLVAAGLRPRRQLGSYEEEPWTPAAASTLLVEAVHAGEGETGR